MRVKPTIVTRSIPTISYGPIGSHGEQGLEVIGAYHSHPDLPPVPSPVDAQEAFGGFAYVIVEVRKGRAAEMRSWLFFDDEGFREQTIVRVTA